MPQDPPTSDTSHTSVRRGITHGPRKPAAAPSISRYLSLSQGFPDLLQTQALARFCPHSRKGTGWPPAETPGTFVLVGSRALDCSLEQNMGVHPVADKPAPVKSRRKPYGLGGGIGWMGGGVGVTPSAGSPSCPRTMQHELGNCSPSVT